MVAAGNKRAKELGLTNCRFAVRVFSSGVTCIIRGKTEIDLRHGQSMMTHVNGQDIKMTFVDHPHTSAEYQRDLSAIATRGGVNNTNVAGLKNVRWSEKHNQLVVDVHSKVKDPLGTIERAKNRGEMTYTKKHVGQKFKVRGKKK